MAPWRLASNARSRISAAHAAVRTARQSLPLRRMRREQRAAHCPTRASRGGHIQRRQRIRTCTPAIRPESSGSTARARRIRLARKHARRPAFHQAARNFLPHALGHQRVGFAIGDHLAHQLQGLRRHRKSKRAAKRATRRMRTGSSANAGPTWRSTPALRSATPLYGSISVPSASFAMALMVRSRRARSCSSVTSGAA